MFCGDLVGGSWLYRSVVSIVKSDSHYEGVLRALKLIDGDFHKVVGGRKKFFDKA